MSLCTSTDNQTITKKKYTKHKITNPNTNKLPIVKHTKPNPKTVHKKCSYQCADDCAQLHYTIQH